MSAVTAPLRRIQRFEIVAQLGVGGTGAVYRARDPQLERDVAIKVLRSEARAPELAWPHTLDLRAERSGDSLLAEARVMARLNHPNVLSVFEAGLHEGSVFLVMELVEGTDLRRWLGERPSPDVVCDAFEQAGRGLAAAHALDIVHGDFKPDNILMGRDGRVRVADFGLSQLTARPTGLVRSGDTVGTPEYMAPEVLRGAAPSRSSDVYAFAHSLVEALGGVGAPPPLDASKEKSLRIAPRLRALLRAALDDDPGRRPALGAILAALARPRRRGWMWRLVGAAAGGLGIAAAFVLGGGESPQDCARAGIVTPQALAQAMAVRRAVRDPDEVLALLDLKRGEISRGRQRACQVSADREITATARTLREACLARRELEIDAIVQRIARRTPSAADAGDWVFGMASISACDVITVPPSSADRAAVAAVFDSYLRATDLATTAHQLEAFVAVEREAGALGERELEARCASMRGFRLRDLDQIKASIDAFQLAHQRATAIEAFDVAAVALLERANVVSGSGDFAGAHSLVSLALELVDKPGLQPWARARLIGAAARSERQRAHYRDGLALAERGRRILADSGRIAPFIENVLRQEQLMCLAGLGDRGREALALAEDNVAFARRTIGEAAPNYAVILGDLAAQQFASGKRAESLATTHRAVEVMAKTKPPTNSELLRARAYLADQMMYANDYRGGRAEIVAVLAAAEDNEAVRDARAGFLHTLAEAEYNLGAYDEAMRVLQQAIDEEISVRGKDHPETTFRMRTQLRHAFELGRIEEAHTALQRVKRAYAQRAETKPRDKITLQRYEAELAIVDRKPVAGEEIARRSLASLQELGLDKTEDMADMYDVLAASLLAQHRWAEALAASERALSILRAAQAREDALATKELRWIDAAMMLGRVDEARARAITVRDLLATYPGRPRERRQLAALATRLQLDR